MRSALPLVALATALALTACEKKTPPVDFRSRVVHVDRPAPTDAPVAAPAPPPFRARDGVPVGGDGRSITLGGHVLTAPPGQRFVETIPWDYDRDGTDESLFVTRVLESGDAAGVSLARPVANEAVLANVDGPEPEDRSCGAPHLRQTSPRSLVVAWRCPEARPAPAPGTPRGMFSQQVVLMGPIGQETGFLTRVGLLRGEGPEFLGLSLEGVDTDGDQVDELVLEASVARPGVETVARARLTYFQRGGSFALDTREPVASVAAFIDPQRRRAGSRRAAPAVVAAMEDALRLRRALCQDTGFARFKLPTSVGLRCRPDPFEGAAEVLLRAYVTLGELPAAWAMTRAESAHPLGLVALARVRSALEGASTPERGATAVESPRLRIEIPTTPSVRHPLARWETSGDLRHIVFGGAPPTRVDREDWSAFPAPELPPTLAAREAPTDPSRTRALAGVGWSADGFALRTCPADASCARAWESRELRVPDRDDARVIPFFTPSDAPALGSGSRMQPYLSNDLHVLGWGPEGIVVSLRGLVWRVPPTGPVTPLAAGERWGGTYPPGQSITEDGAVAALPAPEGVWLHEGTAWRRLAPDALRERLALARDAAPSADGRAVLLRMEDNTLAVIERARAARR